MKTDITAQAPPARYALLLLTGLLLAGAALRALNLMNLPMYVDESLHAWRSQRIAVGQVFEGIDQNKWFYSAVVGVFLPTGPEAGFIARWVSGWWGLISLAGCAALGRKLGGVQAALLAAAIYTALPFALFHERQALVDAQLAAFTTLILLLGVFMARRLRWWHVPLLALLLSAAYLTKVAGLPYFAMPFAAVLLFGRGRLGRLKGWGAAALPVMAALGLRAWLYAQAAQAYVTPRSSHTARLSNTILGRLSDPATLTQLQQDLGDALTLWLVYAGPVVIGLALLGALWALLKPFRRLDLIYMAAPALIFLLVPLLAERPTGEFLPARYMMTSAPPMAVLAALALDHFSRLVPSPHRRWPAWIALALMCGQGLWFGVNLVINPLTAPIYAEDRRLYYYNISSGLSYHMAGAELARRVEAGAPPVVVVFNGFVPEQLGVQLGPRIGESYQYRPGDEALERTLARHLAAGYDLYMVNTVGFDFFGDFPASPYGTHLTLDQTFTAYDISLELYRAQAISGPLAGRVYAASAPEPGRLRADYAALGQALDAAPGGAAYVFPAAHFAEARQHTFQVMRPLQVPTWPASVEVGRDAIAGIPYIPGQQINLILVDETRTDPNRALSLAAQARFYRLGDAYFGLLHHLSYVTGPQEPPFTASDAVFEGGIALEQAAVIDQQVAPGGALRLALAWRPEAPIADSFSVFVHLVDESGTLHAQADGVPGGGLLPMNTWQAGALTQDRLALRLPGDLPAGRYALWIGIYNPANGLRLPVIAGQGHGGDYAVLGHIEVLPAPPGP